MSGDTPQRLPGESASSDPYAVLGLPAGSREPAAVQAALRQRIAEVFERSSGRRDEAEKERRRLRAAAEKILKLSRRSQAAGSTPVERGAAPPTPAPALTDFDRSVLAVLVGCRGWNATSRTRLVALASACGISVQGLMRVVTGLCTYVRRGGTRVAVAQTTSGGARVGAFSAGARGPEGLQNQAAPGVWPDGIQGQARVAEAAQGHWLRRLAAGFRPQDAWATARLAVFFGVLTVMAGLLAVWLLFFRPDLASRRAVDLPPAAVGGTRTPVLTDSPAEMTSSSEPSWVLARFDHPPTFLGLALTADAARAGDACPQLPGEISELARRITVARVGPSEAVYRGWDACMKTAGTGWVLIDVRTRAQIEDAIFEALYAASDSPSVADRLLATLRPPSEHLADPIDTWRGAWMAGILGRISVSTSLPPALVERAQTQLQVALDGPLPPRADFEAAAGAWLSRSVGWLVEAMEFDDRTYDFWESWIAAQRRLGGGERLDAAFLGAVGEILRTSTDLSRQGPSLNVLGRLLAMADFESSAVVKAQLIRFFDDSETIGTHDLWVLTSLLARREIAKWFSEDLVLPDNADWMFRRRIADRIAQRWPETAGVHPDFAGAGGGNPIDDTLAARFSALLARELQRSIAAGTELLGQQLLAASRLNEIAAALGAGRSDEARQLLDRLDQTVATRQPGPGGSASPAGPKRSGPGGQGRRLGQPIGPDGRWTVAYEQAGRNTQERLSRLGLLHDAAGTDLGVIDAEVFVRVVYRGTPQEVRARAQRIVARQFATGPNVAREMLDQFPGAPMGRALAETIKRLTGRVLPRFGSHMFKADARLALLEHLLALESPESGGIDRLAQEVSGSYVNRRRWVSGSRGVAAGTLSAEEAAQQLVDRWRLVAEAVVAQAPAYRKRLDERHRDDQRSVGGRLADLKRRGSIRARLARGPVQRFVAAQLSIAEVMAFVIVEERPVVGMRVTPMMNDAAVDRAALGHVLGQAVSVERLIGRLWSLRLRLEDSTG